MKLLYSFVLFSFFISCNNPNSSESDKTDSDFFALVSKPDNGGSYPDGSYCAEVDYYNPATGTESSYTLTVEIEDNDIVKMNFPNGGYLDDEILGGAVDSDGQANFTSTKGYEYEVKILGEEAGCFDDTPLATQCQGITKKGKQCKNLTDNYSGYCYQHEEQF